MTNAYDVAGYNNGEIGFGKRPAVLVVDLQKAFTDPRYPLRGFSRVHAAPQSTAKPPGAARGAGRAGGGGGGGARRKQRRGGAGPPPPPPPTPLYQSPRARFARPV